MYWVSWPYVELHSGQKSKSDHLLYIFLSWSFALEDSRKSTIRSIVRIWLQIIELWQLFKWWYNSVQVKFPTRFNSTFWPNYNFRKIFKWGCQIMWSWKSLLGTVLSHRITLTWTNKLGPHFRGLGITFMPFAYFRKKLPNKHFRDHFVCKYVD